MAMKISQTVKKAADIKESTLYPILKKLQSAGYLTTYSQEYQGRKEKILFPYRRRQGTDCISEQ